MIYVYRVQYNEQGQELDRQLVGPVPDQAAAEALQALTRSESPMGAFERFQCYEQEQADPVAAREPAKLPGLPAPLGGGK